jgi:hypothetical protein
VCMCMCVLTAASSWVLSVSCDPLVCMIHISDGFDATEGLVSANRQCALAETLDVPPLTAIIDVR